MRRLLDRSLDRLFNAAHNAYRAGRYGRARRLLRLKLRLTPDDLISRLHLARCERELGRADRSMGVIREVLERRPGWLPGLRHAVDLHLRAGRESEARRTLEQGRGALEAHRDEELNRLFPLALSLVPGVAVEIAELLLARRPDEPARRAMAGEAVAYVAEEEAAIEIADRLAASREAAQLAAAIRIYEQRDRLERALELAPELVGAEPEELVSVARTLQRRGFSRHAIQLLELAGDDPEATAIRSRIEG